MDVFARRTSWPEFSNRLALALEARRASGLPILDLTQSNPTRCGFAALSDARLLAPLADERHLRYDPDPRGLERAREAVRDYYAGQGIQTDPGRIFLFSGTSESYAHLFRLLGDPGDVFATPRPSYPLLDHLAALADVTLTPYRLIPPDWRIDWRSLGAAPVRPKAVVTIHPNNPTGHYLDAADRGRLASFCGAGPSPAAWISDEVFLDYPAREGPPPRSALADPAPLVFALGGASKLLGLPQMKVAWVAVGGRDDALAAEAARRMEWIADSYLSASTPAQGAFAVWMGRRAEITGEILDRVRANRLRLEAALDGREGARALPAQGGWCSVVELDGRADDEETAVELLERFGVHTHPGYFYDFEERPCCVVSLLPPPEAFAEAVDRLAAGLKQILSERRNV